MNCAIPNNVLFQINGSCRKNNVWVEWKRMEVKMNNKSLRFKSLKSLMLVLLALGFGFGIVIFSTLQVSNKLVLAQTGIDEEASESAKPEEIKPVMATQVDYYLPYPGILPDHPLYWLKMFRDKIMIGMTKDLTRVEKLLLYADKRVGAAEVLIKGGKIELGVTTATKAEKYLEEAVLDYEKLTKAGKGIPELQDKLSKATLKHEEMLKGLLERLPDQLKPTLDEAIKKAVSGQEKIKQI